MKRPLIVTTPELAAYCRQLRESAGLSQAELAAALDVGRADINHAENPEQTSRHAIRKRILQHFGKSAEEVWRVS